MNYRLLSLLLLTTCFLLISESRKRPRGIPYSIENVFLSTGCSVIKGKVLDSWTPNLKKVNSTFQREEGKVHKVEVDSSIFGSFKKNDILYFYDGFTDDDEKVNKDSVNLLFFSKLYIYDGFIKQIDFDSEVIYSPIRVAYTSEKIKFYETIINIEIIKKLTNIDEIYKDIVENTNNRFLFKYCARRLPRLNNLVEQETLLRERLDRSPNTNIKLLILRMLDNEALNYTQIKSLTEDEVFCDMNMNSIQRLIDQDNIYLIKSKLLDYALRSKNKSTYFNGYLAILKQYAKESTINEIIDRDLPDYVKFPKLSYLGAEYEDVKAITNSKEEYNLSMSALKILYDIRNDSLVNKNWLLNYSKYKNLVPILEPILKENNSPKRKFVTAFIRSLNYDVVRVNNNYSIRDTTKSHPIVLTASIEKKSLNKNDSVIIIIREKALRECVISTKNTFLYSIHSKDYNFSINNKSSADSIWLNKESFNLLDSDFIKLKPGDEIEHNFKIGLDGKLPPDEYKMHLSKLYHLDGLKSDRDAWTGLLYFENQPEFKILDGEKFNYYIGLIVLLGIISICILLSKLQNYKIE